MTQTTPSHSRSQAVEAAAELLANFQSRLGSRRENCENKALWDQINVASAGLHALRAELTSQQEVAAPVSDAEIITACAENGVFLRQHQPGEDDRIPEGGLFCETTVADIRGIYNHLAASRVPVASLASREQVNLAACVGGGVWVPEEPTEAMYAAFANGVPYNDWSTFTDEERQGVRVGMLPCYQAMIAAAQQGQEGGK